MRGDAAQPIAHPLRREGALRQLDEQRVMTGLGRAEPAVQAHDPALGRDLRQVVGQEVHGLGEPLLERVLPLVPPASDEQPFKLPEQTLAPPRPGQPLTETFPATSTVAPSVTVEGGPLEVLRFAPEGEIPIAPVLNVTLINLWGP